MSLAWGPNQPGSSKLRVRVRVRSLWLLGAWPSWVPSHDAPGPTKGALPPSQEQKHLRLFRNVNFEAPTWTSGTGLGWRQQPVCVCARVYACVCLVCVLICEYA